MIFFFFFSGLTRGYYKGFTWQASERKQLPSVDLLQSQGLVALALNSSGPTAGHALYIVASGFPGGSDSKRIHLQCKRPGFNSWVRKGMASYSSTLACRIPWTEEPGRAPWGGKEPGMTEQLTLSLFISVSGAFIPRALYLCPGQKSSSGDSAKTFLLGGGERNLKTLFPTLTQSSLHFLSFPAWFFPPFHLRIHTMPSDFCWEHLQQ